MIWWCFLTKVNLFLSFPTFKRKCVTSFRLYCAEEEGAKSGRIELVGGEPACFCGRGACLLAGCYTWELSQIILSRGWAPPPFTRQTMKKQELHIWSKLFYSISHSDTICRWPLCRGSRGETAPCCTKVVYQWDLAPDADGWTLLSTPPPPPPLQACLIWKLLFSIVSCCQESSESAVSRPPSICSAHTSHILITAHIYKPLKFSNQP